MPLGFVGRPHADGHLLGYGVALPRALDHEQRTIVRETLARALAGGELRLRLVLGDLGEWTLEPEDREPPPWTLDSKTYAGPARTWASVSPVVLDRYAFKPEQQEEIVAKACERVDLPPPMSVVVSKVSPLEGVPAAREFPGLRKRYHVHALVRWEEPVRGPILIGAGRFLGYGLLRPWRPA